MEAGISGLGAKAILELVQGALAARYRVGQAIGRGAYSVVFRVENRALERAEALKVFVRVLDEEASSRFFREARLAARLDHPHIVKVYEFGEARGIPWYTMQLIDGTSLAQFLKDNGPLSVDLFLQLADPILDAMSFSHDQGIIHRDIKPQNLLVDAHLRPYVADFGLAKSIEEQGLTTTGTVLGTPGFVAPEVLAGERPSFSSDIYALGVTFYQMLSGRLPFKGREAFELMMACVQQEPTRLSYYRPDIPPWLEEAIMWALARSPHERCPSLSALRAAFSFQGAGEERLITLPRLRKTDGEQTESLMVSAPTVALRKSTRKAFWLPLTLVVAAALVIVAVKKNVPSQPLGRSPAQLVVNTPSVTLEPSPEATPLPEPTVSPSPEAQRTPTPAPTARSVSRAVTQPYPKGELFVPVGSNLPDECLGLTVPFVVRIGVDGAVLSSRVLGSFPASCVQRAEEVLHNVQWVPAHGTGGEPLEATIATAVNFAEDKAKGKGEHQ